MYMCVCICGSEIQAIGGLLPLPCKAQTRWLSSVAGGLASSGNYPSGSSQAPQPLECPAWRPLGWHLSVSGSRRQCSPGVCLSLHRERAGRQADCCLGRLRGHRQQQPAQRRVSPGKWVWVPALSPFPQPSPHVTLQGEPFVGLGKTDPGQKSEPWVMLPGHQALPKPAACTFQRYLGDLECVLCSWIWPGPAIAIMDIWGE